MCGIHLQVWRDPTCSICRERITSADQELKNLGRRGPDAQDCVTIPSAQNPTVHRIQLSASVLQMRHELVQQPVLLDDNNTSYLCWNGELYQTKASPQAWDYDTSDTVLVADLLRKQAFHNDSDATTQQNDIAQVMSSFYNAEFAFAIVTPTGVFYGRDVWGRRSLLRWDCPSCGSFQFVSVPETLPTKEPQETDAQWIEILPGRVHHSSFLASNNDKTDTAEVSDITPSPLAPPSPSLQQDATTTILDSMRQRYPNTLKPAGVSEQLWEASLQLEYHLDRAVQMRMAAQSSPLSSTAVLFSGGLDSAVIAALAARHSQKLKTKLYLYNVSFGDTYAKSADRQAALVTYETFQEQGYSNIIFQDIIVSWEELSEWEPHIRTLLQPKTTLMDINIATALWFASRGVGSQHSNKNADNDEGTDKTRVLLLGMGADEQMGGYGRHRKAFQRGGLAELQKELEMDQDRFWERNLGRDDRICADHGKEARFPFLDPHVVHCLRSVPLELICDFGLPPGQGDKRILRLVAMRLGIHHASGLVKRAIQFGSRISHLSDAKRFGSRRKAKGQAEVVNGPSPNGGAHSPTT